MYGNIKNGPDGNLKGEVGEVIAKFAIKKAISTREFHYTILKEVGFNHEQVSFLQENWKSFDLIDLEKSTIYEVKTRKYFNSKLRAEQNKPEISPHFLTVAERALILGFKIKVVDVTFFSDWKYGIEINEFNKNKFRIRQRLSGWARQLKSKKNMELNNLFKEEALQSVTESLYKR